MNLVTLDDIKLHLRYDDDADDETLLVLSKAAHQAVLSYITVEPDDDNKAALKTAVLLMVGYLDDGRNAEHTGYGNFLPPSVRMLLSPYHRPSVY